MATNPAGAPTISSVGLSLRLLTVATAKEALKAEHSLHQTASEIGELWVGQSPAKAPGWVDFLSGVAPGVESELRTQSCSAVLFVETTKPDKRLFALCFGQGHHALEEHAIARGFGLRVTLNQVSRDRLRMIDSATLDSTVMQRRTQASRNADLRAFEIDTNRDLVRLASGNPQESTFAKALTGRDALSVRGHIAPKAVLAFCERALEISNETSYKRDFSFIDHIQPVGPSKLRDELDKDAFNELQKLVNGDASDLHLAIPDIISPENDAQIGYFGSGLPTGRKTVFSEVSIDDYVSELRRGKFSTLKDMAAIKASHEICVVENGETDRDHRRKLYSCIVHEAQRNDETYVLFDGQWHLIDREFYAAVDAYYNNLLATPFIAQTTAKNERLFITQLLSQPNLLCLDQTRVNPKGAKQANLEPCDFLSMNRELIHLKDGHGSSPLSHLWNQGLVSTESFVRDFDFRKNFRKVVKARETQYGRSGFYDLIPDGRTRPSPADFTIVYGVMRHPNARSKSLTLPFFSKIALRAVAERLDSMGFKVELHLIEKV